MLRPSTFATFKVADFGGGAPGGTAEVKLTTGGTGNGTLLGTSQVVTIPSGTSSAGVDTEFDFASPITLTPGTLYSLVLSPLTGAFGPYYTGVNAYAGGTYFDQGSTNAKQRPLFHRRHHRSRARIDRAARHDVPASPDDALPAAVGGVTSKAHKRIAFAIERDGLDKTGSDFKCDIIKITGQAAYDLCPFRHWFCRRC